MIVKVRPGVPYTPTAAQQDEAASRRAAGSVPRRPGGALQTLVELLATRRDSPPGTSPRKPMQYLPAPGPIALPQSWMPLLSPVAPVVDPMTPPPPAVPITAAEPRTEIPALGRLRRRPRSVVGGL